MPITISSDNEFDSIKNRNTEEELANIHPKQFALLSRKLYNLKRQWAHFSKNQFFLELSKFGYYIRKKIGGGSYSKVYYAELIRKIDCENGEQTVLKRRPFACKVIDRRNTSDEFCLKFLPREIAVLKSIAHPYLVAVESILEMGPFICVVMEFCPGGDLLDYIRKKGALGEKRSKLFFFQLTSAIQYLHSRNIAHRDIKCENVLIQDQNCVKLTDFGFSRHVGDLEVADLSRTFCGSTAYAAPEILKGIPYTPKCYDMWSLGCVLYVMMFGTMPYDEEDIPKVLKKQEENRLDFPLSACCSSKAHNIICQLMQCEVKKRLTVNEVLAHPWLRCFFKQKN